MPVITINPSPSHPLSRRLYMQFMEPLGTTDSSVEAGWDFIQQRWRPDFLEVVTDLAPGAIRWGGILTSYWKWREGVGPREGRTPMPNYLWGGLESNQIGVHEILELCRQVAADPILGINFAADGRPEYLSTGRGENRAGTPEEAADLVSYCNDSMHAERAANRHVEPWGVQLWQLGNETSYPAEGHRFSSQENARTFLDFALAMRARDPAIKLIGWGDQERDTGHWWLDDLLDAAGDEVDYVAAHMMRQVPQRENTVLRSTRYRDDYDRAWAELLEIYDTVEQKLLQLKERLRSRGSAAKIAITEGHLSLQPHNRNPLLQEWLAGLYHAKVLNLYERHGDAVEIATLADFFGNAWTVNAVMIPSYRARPFLMPVGSIMRLYSRNSGEQAVALESDTDLDLVASRTGDKLYLHAVNGDLGRSREVTLSVQGERVARARAFTIAPESVSRYVSQADPDIFAPKEEALAGGEHLQVVFPAASVTVLELKLKSSA